MKERKLTRRKFLFSVGTAGVGLLGFSKSCRRQEERPEPTPAPVVTRSPSPPPEVTKIAPKTPGITTSPSKPPPETLPPETPLPEPTAERVEKINLFAEIITPALKNEVETRRREKSKDPEYVRRIDEELNRERINFLLLGTGSEKKGEEVGFLTDSIQLVSLDTKEGSFDILTLHRDVEAPEIARFLKTDVHYRLNAAFKIGGFPLIREVIEDATGLAADFTTVFKMEVFQGLVDEVFGQLEVDLPREIDDPNMGYFAAGKQILDGDQALRLSRARFYASNYERNLIQQLLIKAMFTRFKKESLLGKGAMLSRALSLFERETRSGRLEVDFEKGFFLDLGKQALKIIWQKKLSPFKKYKFGLPEIDSTFAFDGQTGMLELAGDPEDKHRLKAKGGDPKADPLDYWSLLRFKTKEFLEPSLLAQEDASKVFAYRLREILPSNPRALEKDEKVAIERLVRETVGIKIKARLEGKQLPKVRGLMATEQHLERFPGDQASDHDEFPDEGIRYIPGAYGWFTESREEFELNPKLKEMEKYYVAVRTWDTQDLIRRFNDDKEKIEHFWQWFRYRKMLVINPENGKMVVAIVGDAGPAEWTGSQFGGSPEVMDRLGLKGGLEKGIVLLFFVDDPEDKIPLGPVEKSSP